MNTVDSKTQYSKMTLTPIPRLILTLGMPTTVSMLVTNIYNIADTYFVSNIGTSASGATGIVFALMAIIQAFGFMLGQGAGSNMSRQLGRKNLKKARKVAATRFYLSLLCGLIIMIFGLMLLTPLMRLLGSTDSILPYARIYSVYILIAAPAMSSSCVLNNILRYEGKAIFAMFGLVSGGLLNILGDYILIYQLHLGISGAGLSTATSQYISTGILLIPFITRQIQSSVHPRYFTHEWCYIHKIITIGCPSILRQGLSSISIMVLNQCASVYGDAAIAAMSIVSRVMNFLFCIAIGIGQGFQPVSAFNFGAGKYDRVKKAWKFAYLFSTVLLSCIAVLGFLFAKPIITLFRDDPNVIIIGIPTLRLQCISLIFMPLALSGNMLFQSIGKSGRAIFLASVRSGLLFIPILLILNQYGGLTGIQMSQTLADILAGIIAAPMIYMFLKKM